MSSIPSELAERLVTRLRGMEVAGHTPATTSLARFSRAVGVAYLLDAPERWQRVGFRFGGRVFHEPVEPDLGAGFRVEEVARQIRLWHLQQAHSGTASFAVSSFAVVESAAQAVEAVPSLFPHLARPDLTIPDLVRTPVEMEAVPGALGVRSRGPHGEGIQIAFTVDAAVYWLLILSRGFPIPPFETAEVVEAMTDLHGRVAGQPLPAAPAVPRPRPGGPARSRWRRMRRFPVRVATDYHQVGVIDPETAAEDSWPVTDIVPGERLWIGADSVWLLTESRGGGRYVVEVWPHEPQLDLDEWDEIAEADLHNTSGAIQLVGLMMEAQSRSIAIDPGLNRLRVCCSQLASSSGVGQGSDRYLLQIFPSGHERGYLTLKRWAEAPDDARREG